MINTSHEVRYWVYRDLGGRIVAEFLTIQECGVWEASLLDTEMSSLFRKPEYRSIDYVPVKPKEV